MSPRTKNATASPSKSVARRPAYRDITSEYVASLMAYADMLFKAGMVPKGKGSTPRPETVAAIIEVGRDVGLPATQALAWIMLVNGKPSIWGDAAMALIRASGLLAEGYPKERYEGTEGEDDFAAIFAIKRVDGSPERITKFSVADAKAANLWGKAGPWQEYAKRQLMWRAKGFACRDEFPDVLCGLIFAEEALDYPNVTVVARVEEPAALPAAVMAQAGAVDAATAEEKKPEPPPPAKEETASASSANELSLKPESVTEEQIARLVELRDMACTSCNLREPEERNKAWRELLKPLGVTSALDLSEAMAAELIEHLGREQDPFTHPPARASG